MKHIIGMVTITSTLGSFTMEHVDPMNLLNTSLQTIPKKNHTAFLTTISTGLLDIVNKLTQQEDQEKVERPQRFFSRCELRIMEQNRKEMPKILNELTELLIKCEIKLAEEKYCKKKRNANHGNSNIGLALHNIDNLSQGLVTNSNQPPTVQKLIGQYAPNNNQQVYFKKEKRNHYQPSVLHKQPHR